MARAFTVDVETSRGAGHDSLARKMGRCDPRQRVPMLRPGFGGIIAEPIHRGGLRHNDRPDGLRLVSCSGRLADEKKQPEAAASLANPGRSQDRPTILRVLTHRAVLHRTEGDGDPSPTAIDAHPGSSSMSQHVPHHAGRSPRVMLPTPQVSVPSPSSRNSIFSSRGHPVQTEI